MMTPKAGTCCCLAVSASGGYWKGLCRRPIGHAGKHRQAATVQDKRIGKALGEMFRGVFSL